jgi:hypothetical protein
MKKIKIYLTNKKEKLKLNKYILKNNKSMNFKIKQKINSKSEMKNILNT